MKLRIFGLGGAALAVAVPFACAAGLDAPGGIGGGGSGGGGNAGAGDGGNSNDAGATDAPHDGPIGCSTAAECAAYDGTCSLGVCEDHVCTRHPRNELGSCDDGLYCTENDVCGGGECVGGTQRLCPSIDECHIGACDEALGTCKNVPGNEGGQCDDGDACTAVGVCQGGVCSQGGAIDCGFFDGPCSIGVCEAGLGCTAAAANEGGFCDDGQGSPCSVGVCAAGACVSEPANEGGLCDDDLFCTVDETCQSGACVGQTNGCTAPGDACMVGSCDEASKTCTAVPGNDGGACDDGNDCTDGATCQSGVCQGGAPANAGQACDDHDGCTAGTTCANGSCSNPTSTITQCVDGDGCCPDGCPLDADCLYWASGVQTNVAETSLMGWTPCFSGTYVEMQSMSTILQQCDGDKLLMACRPVGQSSFTLLAMAPRLDVLFDCGSLADCAHAANGVGWYWADDYSWGFAPAGLPVNRNSCDYNDGSQLSPGLRMCWHTGSGFLSSGYRCGDNDLNSSSDWERVVYHAD